MSAAADTRLSAGEISEANRLTQANTASHRHHCGRTQEDHVKPQNNRFHLDNCGHFHNQVESSHHTAHYTLSSSD